MKNLDKHYHKTQVLSPMNEKCGLKTMLLSRTQCVQAMLDEHSQFTRHIRPKQRQKNYLLMKESPCDMNKDYCIDPQCFFMNEVVDSIPPFPLSDREQQFH